jgi:hypothetical protein
MAGWKKDATTEGTHSLNLEGAVNILSVDSAGPPKTTDNALALSLVFSHGYILKAGTGYSVFLGSNTAFIYTSFDPPGSAADGHTMTLAVMPNLVFHKDLGHNFELSSGGSAGLSLNMYSKAEVPDLGFAKSGHTLLTSNAEINLGLRWVKDNFAFEGSVNESLLQSGPNFISGMNNSMFGRIGVSLAI